MAVKISIRAQGSSIFQELELPAGTDIRDIKIEGHGMTTTFETPDKGWRSGRVHTSVELNNVAEPPPEISATFGAVKELEPGDQVWLWRSDATLYSHGQQIIGKDQTNGSKYYERVISSKGWKSSYYSK